MRFQRVGAREFLRLNKPEFASLSIFGDCGAFTYHKRDVPPYAPEEMVEFYDECEFTHGCSVDHIIFDYDETVRGLNGGSAEAKRRYDITLENAEAFLRIANQQSLRRFTPLGVTQGWSPGSIAEAARRLWKMGYRYIAVGGMVPLQTPQIKSALGAIRDAVPYEAQIHVLGFAKADDIASFAPLRITSFDTTSPLLRAFKDKKANYYLPDGNGRLTYYTAIRIPQALENRKLLNLVKRGVVQHEELVDLEGRALERLRAYDAGRASLEQVLESVLAYSSLAELGAPMSALPGSESFGDLRSRYARTLQDRPWKKCKCAICEDLSVEVIIFRASNRNKRRGIHNLGVYKAHLDNSRERNEDTNLFSHTGEPESQAHCPDVRC
jgi:hypothetical protein